MRIRYLILVYSFGIIACQPDIKPIKQVENKIQTTDTTSSILINDSALLIQYIDSLPVVHLPFLSEFYNRYFTTLHLTPFLDKKYNQLAFTKIARQTEGGEFDLDETDTTFDLFDSTGMANWNCLYKSPQWILLESYSNGAFFVTIDYHLHFTDAIRTGMANPGGNIHWTSNRHSTLYPDLKIYIEHEFNYQTDEENGKYESIIEDEWWQLDSNSSHFRHLPIPSTKKLIR